MTRSQPAIILYSARTPNGIKLPLALEELGLDWELRLLDLDAGEQHSPEFLRINPNGRIPALIDHATTGEAFPVFESGAMLLHLAQTHGGLLPTDTQERAAALSWLFFQVASLGPAMGQTGWFLRNGDQAQTQALQRFSNEASRLLKNVENRLALSEWLSGNHYSIADIAHYGWLRNLAYIGLDVRYFPAIQRWLAAIASRPATERALLRMGMA